MKKLTSYAPGYYLFDHYFFYLIVKFIGCEYNLRGAIETGDWDVAHISTKEVLLWAVQVFLYMNDSKEVDRHDNKALIFRRLKSVLGENDPLYKQIMDIEFTNYVDMNMVKKQADEILEFVRTHLVPKRYVEYIYCDNSVDFRRHLEALIQIDSITEKLRKSDDFVMAFPPKINQLFYELSKKIENQPDVR